MITVYCLPNCQPCRLTKMHLDKRGVPYTEVALTEAQAEVFRQQGYHQAPVVDAGDSAIWAGFRPDLLAKLPL